jgi:hypothetical protein
MAFVCLLSGFRTGRQHHHVAQHSHEAQLELRPAGGAVQLRQDIGPPMRHQGAFETSTKFLGGKPQGRVEKNGKVEMCLTIE